MPQSTVLLVYSNDPALRKCIIKKSGLSKVPEGLKKWAGPQQNYIYRGRGAGGRCPPAICATDDFFFEMSSSSRLCISFTFCRSGHYHNILEANGGLDHRQPASQHVRHCHARQSLNQHRCQTVGCAPTEVKKPAPQVKKLAGCCCRLKKPDPLRSACFLNAGWLL